LIIWIPYIHIFRDIKTTNVLVDKDWKKEYTYGTDEFMSPEIALALDFDRSTDIFSFGITVCEAITCKEPSAQFLCRKAQSMFALNESELANAVMQGCPEELEALALQCCDLDTTKRPTIQTCIEELESIMSALGGEDFEFDLETHLSCRQVSEHTADSHSLAVNGVSLSHPRYVMLHRVMPSYYILYYSILSYAAVHSLPHIMPTHAGSFYTSYHAMPCHDAPFHCLAMM
jgi:serine/threonine protein kinase